MPSSSSDDRLPFEPRQNKKKTPKKPPSKTTTKKPESIPEVVSKRMVRRMALFSGLPTGLGVAIFFACYLIVTQDWLKIPTLVPLLLTMGCFGLGVIGLSYGILSTSWEEDRVGTWWGWEEFTLNFGRMRSAWRNAKNNSSH
jgi:Photosynthesis affected mutant 68